VNRFSNINWTAFLFGCLWASDDEAFSLWESVWAYWWGVVFVIVWLLAFFAGLTIPALTLMLYIPLAVASAYFALKGNALLLRGIRELELNSEEEQTRRMMSAARQKKYLKIGVLMRPISHYAFLGILPTGRAGLVAGEYEYAAIFPQVIEIVSGMVIMDIIALVVVLLAVLVRGDKENVLYSGKIPAEVMASVSTKGPPNP